MALKDLQLRFLLIGIFVFLSFFISGNKSLWRDEAFSALISHEAVVNIISSSASDFSPPLYYLLIHPLTYFGIPDDVLLRLIPCLFSILTVALLLQLKKPLLNEVFQLKDNNGKTRKTQIISWLYYLVIILGPVLVYFSAELRHYSFLFFLTTVSVVCITLYQKTQQRIYLFGLTITNILLLYTHNLALFWLLGQLAAVTLHNLVQKKNKILLPYAISFGTSLIFFAPWLRILLLQTKQFQNDFWITFHPFKSLLDYRGLIVVNEGQIRYPWAYYIFIILSLVFGLLGIKRVINKSKLLLLPLLSLGITLIGIYVFSATFRPILYFRYMSFLAPCMLLLIAIGIIDVYLRSIRLGIGFIGLYFLLNAVILTDFAQSISKTDYRPLAKISSSAPIYTDEILELMPCLYYHKNCVYIGDINKTAKYVGVSQLNGITAYPVWDSINQQYVGIITTTTEINEDIKNFLVQNRLQEEVSLQMGDGVKLNLYSRNQ